MLDALLARIWQLFPAWLREQASRDPEPWWVSWAWVIGLIVVIGLLAVFTR